MSTIPASKKDILLLPIKDGGLTKGYIPSGKNKHIGDDFGYYDIATDYIYAVQDAKVVDVLDRYTYVKNKKTGKLDKIETEMGYGIVLQHDYSDGTHRWTGYIHLNKMPTLKVGDIVKQGDSIGNRGKTGTKCNGYHLHIYVTDCTTKKYSWATMKSLCTFEPFPLFYKSHKFNYTLATLPKYHMNELTYLDDDQTEIEKLKKEVSNLKLELKNEQAINMVLQSKLEDIQKIING